MQRSFSDMAHSEKAAIIAMQHSKHDSGKKFAEKYSLSADTVTRYLRINKLILNLKTRLDNANLGIDTGKYKQAMAFHAMRGSLAG